MSTCGTTTTSDRIEAFSFARRAAATSELRQHRRLSRSPTAFSGGTSSEAWFTSITRSRHDVRVSEPNAAAGRPCLRRWPGLGDGGHAGKVLGRQHGPEHQCACEFGRTWLPPVDQLTLRGRTGCSVATGGHGPAATSHGPPTTGAGGAAGGSGPRHPGGTNRRRGHARRDLPVSVCCRIDAQHLAGRSRRVPLATPRQAW